MKQFYLKFAKATYLNLFLGMVLLFLAQGMQAATITSNATGNWSSGGTWVGGVAPTAADDVIIAAGHTVTIAANIVMNAGTTVTVNSTGILQISTTTISGTFGTLSIAGTFANNGTVTANTLTVSTGGNFSNSRTVNVLTSLDGAGTFNNGVVSSAVLNLSGTVSITTLSPGTGVQAINYIGGDQVIKNQTYRTLGISGTGKKTWPSLGASLSVAGVNVASGTELEIANGANSFSINSNGSTIDGILTFTGTANKNINKITISSTGSLIDTNTSSTITASTAGSFINNGTIVTNTLSVGSGTAAALITNNGTITCTALGGAFTGSTFENSATGVLNYNGSAAPPINTFTTSAAGNTVNYGRAGAQDIRPQVYSNLKLSGSGDKTIGTAASSTLCTGTMSISGTAKASITNTNVGVNKLNLGGVGQLINTYGSTGSTAAVKNDTYFLSTSTGTLNVTSQDCNVATPTITAGSATTFCTGGSVTLTSSAATGNQWYKGEF